ESTPKMSYNFVKNVFSPLFIKFSDNHNCTLYNHSNEPFNGSVKIVKMSLPKGKHLEENEYKISLPANSNYEISLSNSSITDNKKTILVGSVYGNNGEMIHRNYQLNKKWKHIQLPQSDIECQTENINGKEIVRLRAKTFSLFIDLYHPRLSFNNRGFIMLPEEEVEVQMGQISNDKININEIKIFSLNDYLGK
ncbi:MAG: hypothetical protein OQJ81_04975, partial [Melioribacteraceae bacterium]|nr:hypothetical protein [Melioribacteraceae bacterium]